MKDMSDPDGDIIPRIASGDEKALSLLIDRHMGSIHALCYRMLQDSFMAEDITQTVFLRTWQMIPNWQPGQAKLITWMRRVATNLCLDSLKKRGPLYTDSLPEDSDVTPNAVDSLVFADRKRVVAVAIEGLPTRQKAALTLTYYQHVSQKEGAEILEVSESAYESLLARARRSLKAALEPNRDDLLDMGQA